MEILFDCFHQRVVLLWRLRGNAEVTGSQPLEVGGITDEDAMMPSKRIFEFGGSVRMDGAEEEVGLSIERSDTSNAIQPMAEALRLVQISVKVRNEARTMSDEPLASLQGKGVDCPRAIMVSEHRNEP